MLLKIILIAFVYILYYITELNSEEVQSEERLGNVTVKNGNISQIHFIVKDPNSHLVQAQLNMIRDEQVRQSALLDNLMERLNNTLTWEPPQYPTSCAEATALSRRSGIYQIVMPGYSQQPCLVRCDEDTQGGGWTIVLHRVDGSVDFFLFWKDYKKGFGNVNGEYFIGLAKLHSLTKDLDQELLLIMEDASGQQKFARYSQFAIDNEENSYALTTLGEYSGTAGDSLRGHVGFKFSAQDRDSDAHKDNCAQMFMGGWWYNSCHVSNLMGKYNETTFGKGINWYAFTGHNASLKQVKMMIRPKRN